MTACLHSPGSTDNDLLEVDQPRIPLRRKKEAMVPTIGGVECVIKRCEVAEGNRPLV
jgi:hypothetical protein